MRPSGDEISERLGGTATAAGDASRRRATGGRRRRRWVTALVAAVTMGAAACGGERPTLRRPSAALLATTTTSTTTPVTAVGGATAGLVTAEPGPSTMTGNIARPVGDPDVRVRPDPASARLPIPRVGTSGVPTVFAVVGPDDQPWLQVLVPTRPNGRTAWVPQSSVTRSRTDVRLFVDLGRRRLTARQGPRTVLNVPVAVGTEQDPTPTGATYVSEVVTADARGEFGPFALGLALHADGRSEFTGGDAQVAITGTDRPDLLGSAAARGDVRMANEDLQKLVALPVPLGSPVFITA